MAVRYFVSDVQTSLRFYCDGLGFSLIEKSGPVFAMVERNGQTLWLSGPGTSASKPMPDGSVPMPGGWNRIVVEVDDIEGTAKSLAEAGTRFRGGLVTGPGGTQVLIEDPDGNPVELFCAR